MIGVEVYDAGKLDRDEWRELQALARDEFTATLSRMQNEIDSLVAWDDPERYFLSHVDPNLEVGDRFNPDQSFSNPRVAVAVEGSEPIGFAFSANNVSGSSKLAREVKRLSVVKNYLWLREVAVSPAEQRQGIATAVGKKLLEDAMLQQPVTAYIWPDEIPFLQKTLEKIGFRATGSQDAQIYGEDSKPVRQVRMQATSVKHVLEHM